MRLVSVVPVLAVVCFLTYVQAAPWHNLKIQQSQVCGDKLADMMSLMCSDRGYNFALKPEVRRFRRGIVEECCRKSCSAAVLQLYCRAEPTDPPSNVQIRKRSDSGSDTLDQQSTVDASGATTKLEVTNTDTTDTSNGDSATNMMKGGEDENKMINLLPERSTHKYSARGSVTKVPNDTTEELLALSNIPPLRHHKNHHHHNRRKIHNRKTSNKTKRDKIHHGGRSFEIGTVRPYFAGRAFASYRTSNLS